LPVTVTVVDRVVQVATAVSAMNRHFAEEIWVKRLKPRPEAKIRLFCFPYVGGGASLFRTWPDDIPAHVEVCSIQLPGREDRLMDPLFTSLTALVETLVAVFTAFLDKPFSFFGHSLGALIAFELACELRRQQGLNPGYLFVSGCAAPHIEDPDPPISGLSDVMFIEELRRLNGTPDVVLQNTALMELLLPMLRADFALYETYHYTADMRLSCPISAFGGLDDRQISIDHIAQWSEYSLEQFTIRMFPGDHFFVHSAQRSVLDAIASDLTQAFGKLLD
jgi:medium-chain acyl-[acyl-carrier-protein] hydrolase